MHWSPDWRSGSGHRPRFRLRQLRAALGHDLAAGPYQRRAHGRGADRGRALRRRERRGRLELRIARVLLERIDAADTGMVKHSAFHAQIPQRAAQAAAPKCSAKSWRKFPFVPGMQPMQADLADLVLNRTWRPFLGVTGADGLPPPASAGNVLRPGTELVLSLRLPPTVNAESTARSSRRSSRPIRPTARASASTPAIAQPGGTPPRPRRGYPALSKRRR